MVNAKYFLLKRFVVSWSSLILKHREGQQTISEHRIFCQKTITSNWRRNDIGRPNFWTSFEECIRYHKHTGYSCIVLHYFAVCLEIPQIIETFLRIWKVDNLASKGRQAASTWRKRGEKLQPGIYILNDFNVLSCFKKVFLLATCKLQLLISSVLLFSCGTVCSTWPLIQFYPKNSLQWAAVERDWRVYLTIIPWACVGYEMVNSQWGA